MRKEMMMMGKRRIVFFFFFRLVLRRTKGREPRKRRGDGEKMGKKGELTGKDEGRGDTHVSEEVRGLVEAVLEEEEEGGEDLREHFCG